MAKEKAAAGAAESGPASGSGGRNKRGRSMRGQSRRMKEMSGKVDRNKLYPIDEGLSILKEVTKGTKFDQTINIAVHLGIDHRHADQGVRGSISLPKGIGKTKRVIAFCDGPDADAARAAGAIEAGVDELVDKISGGWSDFDVAIAHPRAMGKVGRLGRILGPTGKMPSPKNGTVTPDVSTAVREFTAGKIDFKNDKGGNVHAIVGKSSFAPDDLKENIQAFVDHLKRLKPATAKGAYIKRVCVSGTMSPGVNLQVEQPS